MTREVVAVVAAFLIALVLGLALTGVWGWLLSSGADCPQPRRPVVPRLLGSGRDHCTALASRNSTRPRWIAPRRPSPRRWPAARRVQRIR
jgi:hypothetical protein